MSGDAPLDDATPRVALVGSDPRAIRCDFDDSERSALHEGRGPRPGDGTSSYNAPTAETRMRPLGDLGGSA